jgi:BirA family biotin operon repressor/biotin-[acetyl-CoA-carboxylase] ligase
MKKANQQGLALAPHATCVVAELQTAGKGRRGRSWQAGLGASLTFSLLWRFQSGASALSGLSLAVGVGLIRALHALGINQARLKWPNDVLVANGQSPEKLAGILIELQGDMDGPSAAVIGVGVNLKLPEEMRRQIDQPATDMSTLASEAVNPNVLLGMILKHMADVLSEFERGGFEIFREEWSAHHAYHHQAVRLIMPDGREIVGDVSGVASDGILLVHTSQGEQRFSAGEISLRGVL